MARGYPDGGFQAYQTGANISDLGWLTYMLWGFAPLDSLGRPVFLDTFNNGLAGWQTGHDGASAADPVLIGTDAFSPPNAVKFNAGTVGPIELGSDSWLMKMFHQRIPTRAGLEVAWGFEPGACTVEQFLVYEFSATQFYEAAIRFNPGAAQWQIEATSPGNYVSILAEPIPAGTTAVGYVQVKLVADFTTGKYVRAIIGQTTIDLSAFTIPIRTFTMTKGAMLIELFAWGDGTYVFNNAGYVLLTRDEP